MKNQDLLIIGVLGVGAYLYLTGKNQTDNTTPTPTTPSQLYDVNSQPTSKNPLTGSPLGNIFGMINPNIGNNPAQYGNTPTSAPQVIVSGVKSGGGLVNGTNFVYNSPLISATGGSVLVPANTPSGLTFKVAQDMVNNNSSITNYGGVLGGGVSLSSNTPKVSVAPSTPAVVTASGTHVNSSLGVIVDNATGKILGKVK